MELSKYCQSMRSLEDWKSFQSCLWLCFDFLYSYWQCTINSSTESSQITVGNVTLSLLVEGTVEIFAVHHQCQHWKKTAALSCFWQEPCLFLPSIIQMQKSHIFWQIRNCTSFKIQPDQQILCEVRNKQLRIFDIKDWLQIQKLVEKTSLSMKVW